MPLIVPIGMCSKTGKRPELGGCRGHACVARRTENRPPVVPEGEGLRHVAVDVDVAVAVGSPAPGDRVGEQRAPHLWPDEAVDVEVMRVLEHHHRAADDLVPLPRLARAHAARVACSRTASGSVPPVARRWRRARRGRWVSPDPLPGSSEAGGSPPGPEAARDARSSRDAPPTSSVPRVAGFRPPVPSPTRFGEMDGHDDRPAGTRARRAGRSERMGVEQMPTAGHGRGERRQARSEDRLAPDGRRSA